MVNQVGSETKWEQILSRIKLPLDLLVCVAVIVQALLLWNQWKISDKQEKFEEMTYDFNNTPFLSLDYIHLYKQNVNGKMANLVDMRPLGINFSIKNTGRAEAYHFCNEIQWDFDSASHSKSMKEKINCVTSKGISMGIGQSDEEVSFTKFPMYSDLLDSITAGRRTIYVEIYGSYTRSGDNKSYPVEVCRRYDYSGQAWESCDN